MNALLLLSLVPLVYTATSPDPNSSQTQKVYKCRQFKLTLDKPDGKDTHFNINTKTFLKKFALSKKEVLVKESDLPVEQSSQPQEAEVKEKDDVVVVDKPSGKPLWQKTLRWIYGNKILVFGVHIDGEVSDEKQHGKINLSGSLCSPQTQALDQAVSDLVEAAVGVAGQIAGEMAMEGSEGQPASQPAGTDDASAPQTTTPAVQSASPTQDGIDQSPSVVVVQDIVALADQQVPLFSPQLGGGTGDRVVPSLPPLLPAPQSRPFYDTIANTLIPKEVHGIRDYVAKAE